METNTMSPDRDTVTGVTKTKQEIPLFTIVKDGNGMEHKVCNMDHPDICPRKGHIVVEAIRKSKRHETTARFTAIRDRQSGIVYGIVQGIDPRTKDLLFQQIVLGDMNHYDLANSQDARQWAVARMYYGLEGSPMSFGKPQFKTKNREEEADLVIAKAKDRDRASSITQSLKGEQLIDMCRNLGIPPEHTSINLMLAQVIEAANNNPKQFLDIWDNTNRQIITTVNRAKAVGLLRYDTMKGYLWKEGLPIGSNEMQIIDYLTKNTQLLTAMDHESKGLDNFTKEHGEVDVFPKDHRNTEDKLRNELQKELEEVRKMKEELGYMIRRNSKSLEFTGEDVPEKEVKKQEPKK